MNRGTRNYNPLNIRRSKDRWQGVRVEQKDSAFVQFETMAYGYRAVWKTLESYWKYFHSVRQLFSVNTIITRWAPPNENDTKSYIHTVLRLSGLGGKENLPQPSQGVVALWLLIAFKKTDSCGRKFRRFSYLCGKP